MPLLAFKYQDELPLNDIPDLFLRVLMLMEIISSALNFPMSECHVLGVEEAARPARKRGALLHLGPSHQRHGDLPCGRNLDNLTSR